MATTSSSGRWRTWPRATSKPTPRSGASPSFPATCADRSRRCSESRSRGCCASGKSAIQAGWNPCSARFRISCPRTSWTASSSISPRCARPEKRRAKATRRSIRTPSVEYYRPSPLGAVNPSLSAPLNEMKPSRSICKTGNEISMRRRVGIVSFILVAGAVAAAMVGRVTAQDWRTASQEPVGLAPDPAAARDAIIQVYAARVVGWRGVFGVHTWIAVKRAAATEYTVYEIIGWRLRSQDTALVVRHRAPDMRWFGSAPEIVAEKRGAGVEELIARIDKAAHSYPWAGEYSMWPGPNSNTFTAWVLRSVPELEADLPPTAIGKDYSGKKLVGPAPSGRGLQFSLFGLAAFTASAVEGFEVNLLGLSFGINPFDPSLKLPLVGRVGPARAFASRADEAAAHKHAL